MGFPRPPFHTMWHHFVVVYGDGSVPSVGRKIGGKVQENIELGVKDPKAGFTNACGIRMSYSLNNSGVNIPRGIWKTISGGDKKQYIYRVADLMKFLNQTFGKPDKTVKNPRPSDFFGMKGILLFGVQWNDATGHATLWDGNTCSDHCYFPIAVEASIWLYKITPSFFFFLALVSSVCYGGGTEKKHYTPIQYLKNYALSSCIADGYQSKDVVNDATAGANGYKELGTLDVDAYNEAAVLGRKFLAKKYLSQSGEKLILMKCIDLYHSKELDRLARKYANKK